LSYMESHKYFDASIELKQENDQQTELLHVIYQINPGERHKIMKVDIVGNTYFPQTTLRTLLHIQPASLALTHGRFSESLLRSDAHDIENMYRANGFQQV